MTYLLDVNLLLALTDSMHAHHEIAHRWFASKGHTSWATCPITENGFVRIASHPNYPNRPGNLATVLAILKQFCTLEGHVFWPDDISTRSLLRSDTILSSKQLTDIYLLGLALSKKGYLATLDRRIPATALSSGTKALEIID